MNEGMQQCIGNEVMPKSISKDEKLNGFGISEMHNGTDKGMLNGFGKDCMLNGFGKDCMLNGFGKDSMPNGFGKDGMPNGFGKDGMPNGFGKVTMLNGVEKEMHSGFAYEEGHNGIVYEAIHDGYRYEEMSNGIRNEAVHNGFHNEAIHNGFGNEAIHNDIGNEETSNGFGNEEISNGFDSDETPNGIGNEEMYNGTKIETRQNGTEKVYSATHLLYGPWNLDVNLDPPKTWKNDKLIEDRLIKEHYKELQYTLFETGFPETIDRTAEPRTGLNAEHVVVAVLSSPIEGIGILLEGGHQLPDAFHLIMSPSWVSKVPSKTSVGQFSLFVLKAITFHKDGSTFIDEFEYPRQVTYLINYLTYGVTLGERNDGVEVERGLDCPMSSSIELCGYVDDKLWTRCIMLAAGMEVPETLALVMKPNKALNAIHDKIDICEVSTDENAETIADFIKRFLSKPFMMGKDKVVVKPSGPGYCQCIGVSFHHVTDVTSIVDKVMTLLANLDEGCCVLVESFIEHLKYQQTKSELTPLWRADDTLGFRVKATVCRDHNNKPVTSLINVAMASRDAPISGCECVGQSLDSTLIAFNIMDKKIRQKLEDEIREKSEAVLQAIMDNEKCLTAEQRGSQGAQTDIIGIDIIITMKDGQLVPVAIEVNSHDCTYNCQVYEFMEELLRKTVPKKDTYETFGKMISNVLFGNEKHDRNYRNQFQQNGFGLINVFDPQYNSIDAMGRSVRPWVKNMITRSQQYSMRGKHVVVVGAGGFSKRHIWPDSARYGVQIILVDSDAEHFAKHEVYDFIHYDFTDHSRDIEHGRAIYLELQRRGIHVDGCLTFWEDCGPLAAVVSENLQTNGTSFEAALNAKKKSRTQNRLKLRKDCTASWHFPKPSLYSADVHPLTTDAELQSVAQRIKFPAVLKLEHGSSAVGVSMVKDVNELQAKRADIIGHLRQESDYPGIGLGYGNSMMAMEYHGGSEHDVDLVMFNRKLVAAFISDNGPTNLPSCTETAAIMPSCLPYDKQAQLVTAAYQSCTEIGLANGTFNAELKMTSKGPKLIEINARMGGFYLRPWIKRIYGVDIMFYSLMISCGIKPYVPMSRPASHLAGILLLPSLHRHILEDTDYKNLVENMHTKGDILFCQFLSIHSFETGLYEEPFGSIAVVGKSTGEAKEKLLKVCKLLKVDSDQYKVENFVKYFY